MLTRRRVALVVLVLMVLVVVGPLLSSCSIVAQQALNADGTAGTLTPTTTTTIVPARRPSADVTVWCGPDTRNPAWQQQMVALAEIGATAVHGPCLTPPVGYTVLDWRAGLVAAGLALMGLTLVTAEFSTEHTADTTRRNHLHRLDHAVTA